MSQKQDVKQKIVEWMNNLEKVANENYEGVIDSGLAVIQLQGIYHLVTGLIILLTLPIVYKIGKETYRNNENRDDWPSSGIGKSVFYIPITERDGDAHPGLMVLGFACVFYAGFIVMAFSTIFNIWSWVMVFWPKFYVAKKATETVIGL